MDDAQGGPPRSGVRNTGSNAEEAAPKREPELPPHYTVHESARGRILCMDSMGYVDERCDVRDVLNCGSHSATCAAMLAARARPRALIGHDAGIGLREGGISGLRWLARLRIPAATVGEWEDRGLV